MESLIGSGLTIERVLLAQSLALLVLLVVLRLRRWGRGALGRRRAAKTMVVPPGVAAKTPAPLKPVPHDALHRVAHSVAPLGLIELQPAFSTPVPAVACEEAAPEAVPASAPRRRPRPADAPVDTVLSPATLLARAEALVGDGAHDEAAAQLRLCVRLAAKLKQPLIEAKARVELGDLALASGDLTSACEHWQMARTLYADLNLFAEAATAETRMERAHCPTDWVLTQF